MAKALRILCSFKCGLKNTREISPKGAAIAPAIDATLLVGTQRNLYKALIGEPLYLKAKELQNPDQTMLRCVTVALNVQFSNSANWIKTRVKHEVWFVTQILTPLCTHLNLSHAQARNYWVKFDLNYKKCNTCSVCSTHFDDSQAQNKIKPFLLLDFSFQTVFKDQFNKMKKWWVLVDNCIRRLPFVNHETNVCSGRLESAR